MDNQLTRLTDDFRKVIDPGTHAVLDYATAGTFLAMGFALRDRHPRAAGLAFLNGAAVLLLSVMTDYPGGIWRRLSFSTHGAMDAVQASMSAFGPAMLGFPEDPGARLFYAQAGVEAGVIAATDWRAGDTHSSAAI
jgi:hypothetical protein